MFIGNILKDLNIFYINVVIGISVSFVYRLVFKVGDVFLVKVFSSIGEIFIIFNRIDREKFCVGVLYVEENECFFEFEVVIFFNDFFRLIKIKIIVKDINDNVFMFLFFVINIFILENILINSCFLILLVIDFDIGFNGV